MATRHLPTVPLGDLPGGAALVRSPWRTRVRLSSLGDAAEAFLVRAGFDRGPWLAVAFAAGIALWFWLGSATGWLIAAGSGLILALAAAGLWREDSNRSHLRTAAIAVGLLVAAGVLTVWSRSALIGAEPLARPVMATVQGRVLERSEQPAEQRVRLVLAARLPGDARAVKLRVNLPEERDDPALQEGAVVRLRARLMPPAPPMLPGAYDFARTAWFAGYAATGSVLGEVTVIERARGEGFVGRIQRGLSAHVRQRLEGTEGAIAAAFASGDRGAIPESDQVAMRDAGLTHLLSISGLHVSAVIAGCYVIVLRLLALWPWLALRVRLPLAAAAAAALAGIGYTLLTGAQVPTVRSCVGAVLVLGALALGREPLSLRMVAVAVFFVLLLWPESLVGPSFQMSFAAVIAIIALHGSAPVRSFLAPREEAWLAKGARRAAMLLLTGLVIEIALMPIVLYHFHRAGVYGALANVVAIPLVTFLSMPLIALALVFDIGGLGAPFWWLAGQSLRVLLALAHYTAGQPGAVKLMPQMSDLTIALFVAGGLWLALWRGKLRLLGFLPAGFAAAMLWLTPIPDLLISGDGRQVGIAGEDERLLVLRDSRSDFMRDNLLQLAGNEAGLVPLARWSGAQCNRDLCAIALERGGRAWRILMTRSRDQVEEHALSAACGQADIVIADRWLPRSCRPRWLKADRKMLSRTGGLAIDLARLRVRTVGESRGEHGW
ncbi:ComEC/Rec2 family competence protein [Altericroceibacterium xinjiangense]|uniref:ComEC/Rec2 family competence protein n=1 Tax=Altericroceibacterium xinjiangense TaxID=762261 RepID=UPI000F7E2783|nr:ComEC/Rec2 family competence protein [Altericroceibacterium xinjiangense]